MTRDFSLMRNDSDPLMKIRNLDTGEVIRLDDFMDKYDYNTKSKPNKVVLPQNLYFSTFIKEKKSKFYNNTRVSAYKYVIDSEIECIDVSHSNKYVVAGHKDGTITLSSLNDLETIHIWSEHKAKITSVQFGLNDMVLSTSEDGTLNIWEIGKDHSLKTFQCNKEITDACFHPMEPSIILISSMNNTIYLWNSQTGEILQQLNYFSPPTSVTFSPDGEYAIVGCNNGFCFVYLYHEFRYISQFVAGPRSKSEKPNDKVTSIKFLNNNEFLVATNDSRVRLFSFSDFKVVRKYIGHIAKIKDMRLSVSKDQNIFMIPSEDNSGVYIWPVDHEKYYKSEALFHSLMKDRSKTVEGFSYGKEIKIKAAVFTSHSSISRLSVVIGDSCGGISIIRSD